MFAAAADCLASQNDAPLSVEEAQAAFIAREREVEADDRKLFDCMSISRGILSAHEMTGEFEKRVRANEKKVSK